MLPFSCMRRRVCAAQDCGGFFPKEEAVWPVVPAEERLKYGDCSTIPEEVFVHRNVDKEKFGVKDVSKMKNENPTTSMKTQEDFTASFSDQQFDYFVNESPRNTGHTVSTVSGTIPNCSGACDDQLAHSESVENRRNHRRSYLIDLGRKATLKKLRLNGGWKFPSGHFCRWLSAILICLIIVIVVVCTSYFAVNWNHNEDAEQLAVAKNTTHEKMNLSYGNGTQDNFVTPPISGDDDADIGEYPWPA